MDVPVDTTKLQASIPKQVIFRPQAWMTPFVVVIGFQQVLSDGLGLFLVRVQTLGLFLSTLVAGPMRVFGGKAAVLQAFAHVVHIALHRNRFETFERQIGNLQELQIKSIAKLIALFGGFS